MSSFARSLNNGNILKDICSFYPFTWHNVSNVVHKTCHYDSLMQKKQLLIMLNKILKKLYFKGISALTNNANIH